MHFACPQAQTEVYLCILYLFSVFLFYPGLNFKVGGSVESTGSDAKGEKIRRDCQKLLGSGVCLSVLLFLIGLHLFSWIPPVACPSALIFCSFFSPLTASFSLSPCIASHQMAPLLPHQSTLQLFADSTLLSTSFSFFSKSTCLLCHPHQYYKGIFLIDARSHTTLCENSFMMFEHKKETCVCHHIKAGIRTRETENATKDKVLHVFWDDVCEFRALFCRVSWITKKEQPIEGGPLCFSFRRIIKHSHRHTLLTCAHNEEKPHTQFM